MLNRECTGKRPPARQKSNTITKHGVNILGYVPQVSPIHFIRLSKGQTKRWPLRKPLG
uniref:Uncharacterized protein n=1 Tax=Rhizophora mucronata TaxID=61149 RepID=A0A2P2QTC7_RHIMU